MKTLSNYIRNGFGLIKHSSVYFFANILNGAIPFFLLPVLTRYLSPSDLGIVALFQMTVAIMSVFTGLSVQGAANRQYFDQDKGVDLPKYIGSCIQLLAITTTLVFLITFYFQEYLSHKTGIPVFWLIIAVFISGISFISQILLGQWQVRSCSKQYGLFQVSQSLLNILLSLLLIIGLNWNWEGRLWGISIALISSGITALFFLYTSRQIQISWSPQYLKNAFMYGAGLSPHVLGVVIFGVVDRIIINEQVGLADTGLYLVAVQLSLAISMTADAFNKAYVPWLFKRLKKNNISEKRRIVCGTYIYFIIALSIALAASLLAPWFVPWFAGHEYTEAGQVLSWLVIGQSINGMYLMVTNYVYFSRRVKMLSAVTLLCGLFHLFLVYILIPDYGIRGAAIAFTIGMGCRFILTWIVAHKLHPMPWLSTLITHYQSSQINSTRRQ